MLTNNAGFNCNAARVIVQHAGWPQREELLAGRARSSPRPPTRRAYYPGRRRPLRGLPRRAPRGRRSLRRPGRRPAPLGDDPGVDPGDARRRLLHHRGLLSASSARPALAAASVPAEFVDRAVAFCNETLWGTLNVTLIVHPASLKDPAVGAGRRAGDRESALRHGLGEPLGGARLRPRGHPLGGVPRPHRRTTSSRAPASSTTP